MVGLKNKINTIFYLTIFISTLNTISIRAKDLELKSKAFFIYPELTIELKLINNSKNNYYIFFDKWKLITKTKLEEFTKFYPKNDCLMNYFYFFPSEDFGKEISTSSDCSETYIIRQIKNFPSFKRIIPNDSLEIKIVFKASGIPIFTKDFEGIVYNYIEDKMMLESSLHYINQEDYNYFKEIIYKNNQNIENSEVLINNYLYLYNDYDINKITTFLTKFNSRVDIDPKYTNEIAESFSKIVRTYCEIKYFKK